MALMEHKFMEKKDLHFELLLQLCLIKRTSEHLIDVCFIRLLNSKLKAILGPYKLEVHILTKR